MRRRLITTGLLLGGLALAAAACGTSDPQVQARQTGDTTATTAGATDRAADHGRAPVVHHSRPRHHRGAPDDRPAAAVHARGAHGRLHGEVRVARRHDHPAEVRRRLGHELAGQGVQPADVHAVPGRRRPLGSPSTGARASCARARASPPRSPRRSAATDRSPADNPPNFSSELSRVRGSVRGTSCSTRERRWSS